MEVTYDESADAAYIHLIPIKADDVVYTYPCDPLQVNGQINLDFDADERLIGIEVLDASKKLPPEVLSKAINKKK